MRKSLVISTVAVLVAVPLFAFAQASVDFSSFGSLINSLTTNVVKSLGYLALTMAVVVFFFGIVQFIWSARQGQQEAMNKGKWFMVWGLVALFVMFSVWGIIRFAQNMLGAEFSRTDITIPTLNINPAGGGTPAGGGGPVGSGLPSSGRTVGQPCTSNAQCSTGYCGAGFCGSIDSGE